jgi:hypothetical protein
VGVIIPLGILTVIALVYLYFRCKQRRGKKEMCNFLIDLWFFIAQQQPYMATIIPIYNNDNQQMSYAYPYPPHYASMSHDVLDKPPSYEQTVQETSETNTNSVEHSPAILPATTTAASAGPVVSTRNQH